LAERARLSRKAVSALECGERLTPRRDTVRLLTNALGLADAERAAFEAAVRPCAASPTGGGDQPLRHRLRVRSPLPHYLKPPMLPCVVGREGVGRLADGRRVYVDVPSCAVIQSAAKPAGERVTYST